MGSSWNCLQYRLDLSAVEILWTILSVQLSSVLRGGNLTHILFIVSFDVVFRWPCVHRPSVRRQSRHRSHQPYTYLTRTQRNDNTPNTAVVSTTSNSSFYSTDATESEEASRREDKQANFPTAGGHFGYMCTKWRNCSLPAAVRASGKGHSAPFRRGGLSVKEWFYGEVGSWNNSRVFPSTRQPSNAIWRKTSIDLNERRFLRPRHNLFMFISLPAIVM